MKVRINYTPQFLDKVGKNSSVVYAHDEVWRALFQTAINEVLTKERKLLVKGEDGSSKKKLFDKLQKAEETIEFSDDGISFEVDMDERQFNEVFFVDTMHSWRTAGERYRRVMTDPAVGDIAKGMDIEKCSEDQRIYGLRKFKLLKEIRKVTVLSWL